MKYDKIMTPVYSRHLQTSKKEDFATIVKGSKLIAIITEYSIIDV